LLKQQSKNGGWGTHGFSTTEETALAVIALASWYKNGNPIDPEVFAKAQKYLEKPKKFANQNLWRGKVLYCPTLVVEAMTAAAHNALYNLTKRPPLMSIATSYPVGSTKEVAQQATKWAIDIGLCKKNSSIFHSDFVSCSANALRNSDQQSLEIYTDYGLTLLTLDDILDENGPRLKNIEEVRRVFNDFLTIWLNDRKFSKILKNNYKFPKFKSLCLAYANIKQRLVVRKADLQYFVASLQEYFLNLLEEYYYRLQKQPLSLEKYLNIRRSAGGMDTANELAYILHGVNLKENVRKHPEFEKLKRHAYDALIIINDHFSFSKEKKTEHMNYISLLQKKQGINLKQAMLGCVAAYNKEVEQFFSTISLLKTDTSLSQKDLQNAPEIIANQVQAHLEWAKSTRRYIP
jgi:hypothetical protein